MAKRLFATGWLSIVACVQPVTIDSHAIADDLRSDASTFPNTVADSPAFKAAIDAAVQAALQKAITQKLVSVQQQLDALDAGKLSLDADGGVTASAFTITRDGGNAISIGVYCGSAHANIGTGNSAIQWECTKACGGARQTHLCSMDEISRTFLSRRFTTNSELLQIGDSYIEYPGHDCSGWAKGYDQTTDDDGGLIPDGFNAAGKPAHCLPEGDFACCL